MDSKLLKTCTVTSLAFAVTLVLKKISDHREATLKIKSLNEELNREHNLAICEIKKNGDSSEETKKRIKELEKKIGL